jgi:TolB-like protein
MKSNRPNKLARFWQELRRRRVIHVITVYASASFVLIELVNNLTGPLNLPEGLATIVVIVLAVGFPLAIVLSWIYDLTGEGFRRTKPISEVPEERAAKVPNAWKIATYVSFIVIIGLVTLNIIGNGTKLRPGDIQSLVILPFENFTGDDQLDNMVAGMHSLLIGDMGQIGGLRVIGKTSSKMYKDAEKSAKDIARELDVDGVVEATVTCLGEDVCMQIRVIRASGKEEQVWAGDYTEDKGEFLRLYNQITRRIAEEVKVELTPEEHSLLSRSRTMDKDAIDAYLNSYSHWGDLSEEGIRNAIEYLNTALEKEPDWAAIYVGLAQLWGATVQFGYEDPGIGMPKAFEYMAKATELDPDFVDLHFNNAIFAVWMEWDWEKGEREFKKAIAINPSDARTRVYYAHLLGTLQQTDEALIQGRIAAELEPFDPMILSLYAVVLSYNHDWQGAMDLYDKALELYPNHWFATQQVDMVAFHLGEHDRALQAFEHFLPFPETFFDTVQVIYREQGFETAYKRVVIEMENTGYGVPLDISVRYYLLGEYEKTLQWLEIGLEYHDTNMPYITTGFCSFDSLYNNPRFKAIVETLNLPMPKTN